MASSYPPVKNTAFDMYFTLYKSDASGTQVVVNPSGMVCTIIKDGSSSGTTASGTVSEVSNTYGCNKMAFTAGDMNADAIWFFITDSGTSTVPYTGTILTAAQNMDTIDSNVDLIKTDASAIHSHVDYLISASATSDTASGVWAYTTRLLTGCGALTASAIADGVWDEQTSDHTASGSTGAALTSGSAPTSAENASAVWTYSITSSGAGTAAKYLTSRATLGAGATAWTYTVLNSATGSAISDVEVWVSSDVAGTNVIASGTSNNSGVVTFYLDLGSTVYIWCAKDGYTFTNPDSEVVS